LLGLLAYRVIVDSAIPKQNFVWNAYYPADGIDDGPRLTALDLSFGSAVFQ
jgi:hypothetical protein